MRPRLPILCCLALLAGCAPQGAYPSLAPRPIERDLAEERTPTAAPEIPSDPALIARIQALVAQAEKGDAAFGPALAAARTAAAQAGEAGSEAWIEAQQQVSRAEAARVETATALAELDQLGVARAQATNTSDLAALAAAAVQVQGMADRQSEQLEAVRTMLSPG